MQNAITLDYVKAIITGAKEAVHDQLEVIAHPIDDLLYPVSLLAWDAIVIASAHVPNDDGFNEFRAVTALDEGIYAPSNARMIERAKNAALIVEELMESPGPERARSATRLASNILLPGYIVKAMKTTYKCYKSYKHQGMLYKELGMLSDPPIFHDVMRDVPAIPELKGLSLDQIRTQKGSNIYLYVITENRNLLISERVSPLVPHERGFVFHPQLSGLKPVLAAGELYLTDGKITKIDNMTGHFRCEGVHLNKMVETRFVREGFTDAWGKFKRASFTGSEVNPIITQPILQFASTKLNLSLGTWKVGSKLAHVEEMLLHEATKHAEAQEAVSYDTDISQTSSTSALTPANTSTKDESKKKLEKIGIFVDAKLDNLLDLDDIRQKVEVVYNYIEGKAKQERKQADIRGVTDTLGFFNALGDYLGNNALCTVATTGLAMVQIENSINTISTMNSAKLSLADLSSFANIGTAVLTIAKLFGKKKQGPDPSKLVLQAIRDLGEQLHQVKQEMHGRFDRVEDRLAQMAFYLFTEFAHERLTLDRLEDLLQRIETKLDYDFTSIQGQFETIKDRLQSLIQRQVTGERRTRLENVIKLASRLVGPYNNLSGKDFQDAYGDLISNITTLHITDVALVGQKDASIAGVVAAFEQDGEAASDFAVAPLASELAKLDHTLDKPVTNTMLYAFETLALLTLVEKRYQRKDDAAERIAHAELHELERVQKVGQEMQEFRVALRNPALFAKLLDEYQQAHTAFQAEYTKMVLEDEVQVSQAAYEKWLKLRIEAQEVAVNGLRKQEINVNPYRNPTWFVHQTQFFISDAPGVEGLIGWGNQAGPKVGYGLTASQAYIAAQNNVISKQKQSLIDALPHAFLQAKQSGVKLSHYHFHHNETSHTENPSLAGLVLIPYNTSHPLLPAPSRCILALPDTVKEIEALGLGQLILRYRIENEKFIITSHLMLEGKTILVTMDADTFSRGPFDEEEAIWHFYCGGPFPKALETDWVIGSVIRSSGMTLHKDWIHQPKITDNPGHKDKPITMQPVLTARDQAELESCLAQYKTKLQTKFYAKLRAEIANEHSAIGKAALRLSRAFYLLQGAVSHAFPDEATSAQHGFDIFASHPTLPLLRHRADMLSWLEQCKDGVLDAIKHTGERVVQAVEQAQLLCGKTIKDTVLQHTCYSLDEAIAWYQAHAVASNSLVGEQLQEPASLPEQMLRALLENGLGAEAFKIVFANTTPEQQRAIGAGLTQLLSGVALPASPTTRALPSTQPSQSQVVEVTANTQQPLPSR